MKNKDDVRWMLSEAMKRRDEWEEWLMTLKNDGRDNIYHNKKQIAEAVRNYNALRGVVKALQWTLDFPGVDHPLG